jgi:hypothetical protein
MAELLDISAYAHHRGVSRKTVYQWLAKGLISKAPNGKVDREQADRQLAAEGRTLEARTAAGPSEQAMETVALAAVEEATGTVTMEPVDTAIETETLEAADRAMASVALEAVGSVHETLAEAGETIGQLAPDDSRGLDGAGVTLTDARKAKTIQDTHLTRLKVQQLRGELVDRKTAESQAFAAGRLERDAWMAWPARVAAQMAADLRLDSREVHTVLEQYVHEHLAELSEAQTVAG